MQEGKENGFPHLRQPDDVDVTIELRDWLFALEDAQEMADRRWSSSQETVSREERCWHATFCGLRVNAKSSPKNVPYGRAEPRRIQHYPIELVTVKNCYYFLKIFNAGLSFPCTIVLGINVFSCCFQES